MMVHPSNAGISMQVRHAMVFTGNMGKYTALHYLSIIGHIIPDFVGYLKDARNLYTDTMRFSVRDCRIILCRMALQVRNSLERKEK